MKFTFIIDRSKEEEVVITAGEKTELVAQIEALVCRYNAVDRLMGYLEDEVRMLKFEDIACVTVLGGKTCAVATDGKTYRLHMRLYEAESILPSSFIRINKSTVANETHILRFVATIGGGIDAVFQGGHRDYVSRRCFSEIKRRLEKR